MGIIKDTLKKQIDENNKIQFNDTTATVVEYNPVLNVASIRFRNPNGEGTFYRENVSIANTLGGLTGAGIFPGQPCTITFLNNNVYTPVITGFINSQYANKTSSDQGAYLIDSAIMNINKPKQISPMIQNWVDISNTDASKYKNQIHDYTNTDSANLLHNLLNSLNKFKNTEQGITNLHTKSTIKLKENGDIDIFIANNIGIRISKVDKSINLYGKVKINGQEIDLSNIINKG